jgi:hypothetical protein
MLQVTLESKYLHIEPYTYPIFQPRLSRQLSIHKQELGIRWLRMFEQSIIDENNISTDRFGLILWDKSSYQYICLPSKAHKTPMSTLRNHQFL